MNPVARVATRAARARFDPRNLTEHVPHHGFGGASGSIILHACLDTIVREEGISPATLIGDRRVWRGGRHDLHGAPHTDGA